MCASAYGWSSKGRAARRTPGRFPRPGRPGSDYAPSSRSPSRSLSHGPQRLDGGFAASARERREACGNDRRLVDRDVERLVEVEAEPAGGHPRVPARILARDQQRELEGLGKTEAPDLLRSRVLSDLLAHEDGRLDVAE
jgi:hypothetical protein